jgi:hypothetical protein
VTTVGAADGTVGVFLGGAQRLVLGGESTPIQALADPYDPTKVQIGITEGGTTRAFPDGFIAGGSVAGLLRVQNHDLGDARGLLGQLAAAITGSLNAQQALGLDLGQPSGPGAPLLAVGAASVAASSGNAKAGGVPVASYLNGAGVRVSSVSISVVSTSELQPSDYELVADPALAAGSYRLTRLSDGVAQTVSDGDVVDGYRIDIAAPPPAARDRFLLQPVSPATRSMVRALDDPKGIAAAAPVRAAMAAANTGTAAIASLAAVSASINPNLTATITFTDNVGNFSYSLVDTTSALPTVNGTGTFVAGQPITLNGFALNLNGVAEGRRLAHRRQDDRSCRRQRQRERAAGVARCDLRRRANDLARRRRPRGQRHGRLRGGACDGRHPGPERRARGRPVGGGRERCEDGGRREVGSQSRRGGGAADPVPAELPGRREDAAGRAVGLRHAAADRKLEGTPCESPPPTRSTRASTPSRGASPRSPRCRSR